MLQRDGTLEGCCPCSCSASYGHVFHQRLFSYMRHLAAGLDLEKDVIIEIAVIITDGDLRNQILVRFEPAQLEVQLFTPLKCALTMHSA